MINTFVIATHNKNKIIEMRRILSLYGISVLVTDLNNVEETGLTFRENAILKAESAFQQTGKPIIADDSGLCVRALNGQPGIFSARYANANEKGITQKNIDKLLKEMENISDRYAEYVCSICCILPNGEKIYADGKCIGEIGYSMKGLNKFSYDPIFFVGNRSMAEMSPEEKDEISHRGNALRSLVSCLKNYNF